MKFLSNFDTGLENEIVSKYVKMYGKENVFCVHRAKIFRVFYCLLPGFGLLISTIILLTLLSIDTGDTSLNTIKSILLIFFLAGILFSGGRKILRRYFDYKMDFTIVTPQEIAAYNQAGLLTRTSRTIDADKIKTVSVNTSGIWKSIFNYGDLTFLSEGDQSGGGDISLKYVHNVNSTKNKVRELIEPHLQKHYKHDYKDEIS